MILEGVVSRIDANTSEGVTRQVRMSESGGLATFQSSGKYFDLVRRGNVYLACNQAIQALSVNSTTATGLILANPTGSGKNLVLLQLNIAVATAPAAVAVLHLSGAASATAVTHTTPLTVRNAALGGTAGNVGLADSAATVPTPVLLRAIGGGVVGASTLNTMNIQENIDGAIVLKPGSFCCLQSLTTAISVVASMIWEEVEED